MTEKYEGFMGDGEHEEILEVMLTEYGVQGVLEEIINVMSDPEGDLAASFGEMTPGEVMGLIQSSLTSVANKQESEGK